MSSSESKVGFEQNEQNFSFIIFQFLRKDSSYEKKNPTENPRWIPKAKAKNLEIGPVNLNNISVNIPSAFFILKMYKALIHKKTAEQEANII